MSAPSIRLDPDDLVPPFQQIFDQLRGAIERGALAASTPLPTVRQLADDLGVAPNTVARAYAELADLGWLVSEGRRGTRVAGSPPSQDRRARSGALRQAIVAFVETLERRGFTRPEIADELARLA